MKEKLEKLFNEIILFPKAITQIIRYTITHQFKDTIIQGNPTTGKITLQGHYSPKQDYKN